MYRAAVYIVARLQATHSLRDANAAVYIACDRRTGLLSIRKAFLGTAAPLRGKSPPRAAMRGFVLLSLSFCSLGSPAASPLLGACSFAAFVRRWFAASLGALGVGCFLGCLRGWGPTVP